MQSAESTGLRETTAVPAPGLDTLVAQVAQGDENALMALYYATRRMVFSVSFAVTRDVQLSEDVVQETLLRVWSHAASCRGAGGARPWICSIARNLSVDLVRWYGREMSVEEFEDQPLPEALTTREYPDARLDLTSGLARLSREEALAFSLRNIAGLSHLESARLMEVPYHTVRYRYRTAVEKLKACLAESGSVGGRYRGDEP